MKIPAKRRNSLLWYYELKGWEWFKNNEFRLLLKGRWASFFRLWTTVPAAKMKWINRTANPLEKKEREQLKQLAKLTYSQFQRESVWIPTRIWKLGERWREIGRGYDRRLLSSLNEANSHTLIFLGKWGQTQNLPIWGLMIATQRSQKVDFMLELKKSKNTTTDKFLSPIGKSLWQEAENRASSQEISINCNDIDEVPIKEKVCETLKKKFHLVGLQDSGVKM